MPRGPKARSAPPMLSATPSTSAHWGRRVARRMDFFPHDDGASLFGRRRLLAVAPDRRKAEQED